MLSLIVAVDDNFLIGNNNELPWYEPNDLKYFKKVTTGKAVLMGYNTYLSIINRLGKPLPKRENYVLTYETQLPLGGIVVKDLDALIESYSDKELFVIGGKMVYENLLSKVERLYLSSEAAGEKHRNLSAVPARYPAVFALCGRGEYHKGTGPRI